MGISVGGGWTLNRKQHLWLCTLSHSPTQAILEMQAVREMSVVTEM